MKNDCALVLGGTGYLGSWVIHELKSRGIQTFALLKPTLLRRTFITLLTVISFSLGAGTARAQMASGRFVTTFYSYRQYDINNNVKLRLRGYEVMQLNFGTRNLQLHTYLLATNDFLTSTSTDPLLRAANLYFEAKNIGNIFGLKLGRQPVFSHVGVSSFDGLSVNSKLIHDKMSVTAFVGALPPLNEKLELNSDIGNNMLFGGQIYYSPSDNYRIGGTYVNKRFKPTSYYTYRLSKDHNIPPVQDSVLIDPSAAANQFISGDLLYNKDKFSGYFRIDFDLNFFSLNRTEVSLRYSPMNSLSANLGYFHRDSRLPYNSIFSVFDHSGTDEINLGTNYLFTQDISVFGSFSTIFYTGNNSNELTIGTNIYLFTLSFSHNDGFAGNLNGVNAQFIYPFMDRKFTAVTSVSATDYKILRELASKNRLYFGSLGLTYRPIKLLSVTLQGQYYKNPVYKDDLRGYFQMNYYFFKNFSSE